VLERSSTLRSPYVANDFNLAAATPLQILSGPNSSGEWPAVMDALHRSRLVVRATAAVVS
jgi:hypothetical protein